MTKYTYFRIKFADANGKTYTIDFQATDEEDARTRFMESCKDKTKGKIISVIRHEDLKKEREGRKDNDAKLEADFMGEQDVNSK